MKFTSEDLMKAMGLNVGDTIKLNGKIHTFTTKKDGTLICKNVLKQLIDQEFEILPRPKRVGDLECSGDCKNCPLMSVCSWDSDYQGKKIYEVLDYALIIIHDDQEIYDILKARLDKEVQDNDK